MAIEDLEIRNNLVIPGRELRFVASRSGGPGGQHVNKTSSRVTLIWTFEESRVLYEAAQGRFRELVKNRLDKDGALAISCDEHRDQIRNLATCRERLKTMVLQSLVVQKKRRPTRPSRGAKERRLKAKKNRSSVKAGRKYRPGQE